MVGRRQITEISVTVERLIALKKFENVKYCVTATAQVPVTGPNEPAKTEETYQMVLAFCKEKVEAELDRIEGRPVKQPEEPVEDDGFNEVK